MLTHCACVQADGLDNDLSRRIRSHLKENHIAAVGAVLVLPRRAALWRSFRLPTRDLREAAGMLAWRLRREAGGPESRSLIYDFRLVGHDDDGYSVVSVFFTPTEKILPYVRVLEQARIFLRQVTLSTQGLVDWVALASPGEESSYILYAEAGGYEFCVAHAGSPVFSRTFCLSGRQADRPLSLLREVKISFELFRRLKRVPGGTFRGLHVVGRLDRQEAAVLAPFLKSLDEKGARHLRTPARQIWDLSPEGSTDTSSLPWHPTDTSYTSVTGLVLHPGGNPIDMMPSFLKQQARRRISWQTGLWCFVVCYCMVWSVFLSCWRIVVRNTQAAIAYDDAWQKEQPDVGAFQAWAGLRAFQRGVWGTAGMSGVLDEVFGKIPDGVVLTEMRAERGVCSFSGLSPDGRAVLDLRKALASSALFSEVFLDFIGQDAQKNTQRFSMRCRMKEQ